jgi:probable DNA repair protein
VSTAAAEGDAPLRPSPLVAALPAVGMPPAAMRAYRARLQQEYPRAAEAYRDFRAPALHPGEQTRGGTGLIKSQAICPFQSFATHRLGARPLEEPDFGPDALERGRLVHEVLQRVWEELKDQSRLLALDASARRALAERAAARAVTARVRDLPDVYTPKVAELERERLARRVSAWLVLEAARPPFRVRETESEHLLKLGRLSLRTQVDRIDELPDGGRVIIDYKTGSVDVNAWLEPRPDEPQLPLYAIGNPERLMGLVFACLKPGEMRLAGLAAREGAGMGVPPYGQRKRRPEEAPDWDALLGYWQANLTQLAEEHAAGEARAHPKSAADCERCHLSTFCRIHELGGPEGEADDAV